MWSNPRHSCICELARSTSLCELCHLCQWGPNPPHPPHLSGISGHPHLCSAMSARATTRCSLATASPSRSTSALTKRRRLLQLPLLAVLARGWRACVLDRQLLRPQELDLDASSSECICSSRHGAGAAHDQICIRRQHVQRYSCPLVALKPAASQRALWRVPIDQKAWNEKLMTFKPDPQACRLLGKESQYHKTSETACQYLVRATTKRNNIVYGLAITALSNPLETHTSNISNLLTSECSVAYLLRSAEETFPRSALAPCTARLVFAHAADFCRRRKRFRAPWGESKWPSCILSSG